MGYVFFKPWLLIYIICTERQTFFHFTSSFAHQKEMPTKYDKQRKHSFCRHTDRYCPVARTNNGREKLAATIFPTYDNNFARRRKKKIVQVFFLLPQS